MCTFFLLPYLMPRPALFAVPWGIHMHTQYTGLQELTPLHTLKSGIYANSTHLASVEEAKRYPNLLSRTPSNSSFKLLVITSFISLTICQCFFIFTQWVAFGDLCACLSIFCGCINTTRRSQSQSRRNMEHIEHLSIASKLLQGIGCFSESVPWNSCSEWVKEPRSAGHGLC